MNNLFVAITAFCFGYPFVMAFYWMAGAVLYHWLRGRHEPLPGAPPRLADYPPVSILVPCHNEASQLDETFGALALVDYPDFEIIAINDGSTDRTGAMLDAMTQHIQRLRVVHLESNQGKSTALNTGALAARNEVLVCIDGDALLDPHALTWLVRRLQSDPKIGALTGNPRIRNRATLLGRLQVGEFSSILGLIKRAQTVYGQLFTVSGVICAFRKRALHDAGWWARDALTDDVDVSWRIQLAGWHIAFEPKALCWILTPETLRGLWRQRLRWSEGGTATMIKVFPQLWSSRSRWRLIPVWVNSVAAIVWAYAMLFAMLVWAVQAGAAALGHVALFGWPAFSPVPQVWGVVLGITYLLQATLSMVIDERFEHGQRRMLFWIVWYPLVFWGLQAIAAIVGLPRAVLRGRPARGTWTSPDRGIR
jgi:biofilm PGA synthesis N-glycosyltransferase PgaC